jgi:hypothetical protein
MRRLHIVVAVALITASASAQDTFSLRLGNFELDTTLPDHAQFDHALQRATVMNNSEQAFWAVFVECGFLDADGNAVATGTGGAFNVAPHSRAFVTVAAYGAGITRATHAECRAHGANLPR